MAQYSKEIIEKYREALKKNPDSQVFAALSDAYRELGQLELAENICINGLRKHSNFVSGWVILGKIEKDLKKWPECKKALKRALSLSADNILAHQLLGDAHLESKELHEAIKAYKMVLLLNPNHQKVQIILEKLESLTAKDYPADLFEFKKLDLFDTENKPFGALEIHPTDSMTNKTASTSDVSENTLIATVTTISGKPYQNEGLGRRSFLRVLSLIDAFISRNDLKKANELLQQALVEFPNENDLAKRSRILKAKMQFSFIPTKEAHENSMSTQLSQNNSENNAIPHSQPSSTEVTHEDLSRKKLAQQKKLKILNQILQQLSET